MQDLIKETSARLRVNEIDKDRLFTSENLKNIDRDFVIYRFEFQTKETYYSPFIDQIYKTIKSVKAIVNGYRNKNDGKGFFYVLFENTENSEFDIKNQLDEIIPKGELPRQKVKVSMTKHATVKDKDGIPERYLAQLFLNSLAHTCKDDFDNMTGKLYWLVRAEKGTKKNLKDGLPNIKQYVALEILINQDFLLELNVRTFTNIEYGKKYKMLEKMETLNKREHFIIRSDDKKSSMQPYLRNGKYKEEDIFIIVQFKGGRSTVLFFDFRTGNLKSFKESKSGILYRLLEQSEKHLSKYITIQFCKYPFTKRINEKSSSITNNNVMQFFKEKQINIDVADSLKGVKEASELKLEMRSILKKSKKYEFEKVNIDSSKIDAINFRIIHNSDYYKDNNLADEHFNNLEIKDNEKYVIQHLTIEDFKNISENKVNYLLTEAFIKNDLKQKKISTINWEYGEWTFLQRRIIKSKDKEQKDIVDFFLLNINKNGDMKFEVCKDFDLFSTKDYEIYKTKFDTLKKGKYESNNIEGLVISNEGDINVIYRTDKITLQEIEQIGDEFKYAEKNTEISKVNFHKMINEFLLKKGRELDLDKYKSVLSQLKQNVEEGFGDYITKKELNNQFDLLKLSNRTHLKKWFCAFYYEWTKSKGETDVLHSFIKSEERMDELFESNIGIQYREDTTNNEAYYFAGEYSNQIQSSFSTATHIRKIKPVNKLNGEKSKILFEELLPTMNVDFVKKGNPTVIPFPFKYLREWIKINHPV